MSLLGEGLTSGAQAFEAALAGVTLSPFLQQKPVGKGWGRRAGRLKKVAGARLAPPPPRMDFAFMQRKNKSHLGCAQGKVAGSDWRRVLNCVSYCRQTNGGPVSAMSHPISAYLKIPGTDWGNLWVYTAPTRERQKYTDQWRESAFRWSGAWWRRVDGNLLTELLFDEAAVGRNGWDHGTQQLHLTKRLFSLCQGDPHSLECYALALWSGLAHPGKCQCPPWCWEHR